MDCVERNLTYTYDLVSNNWGRDLPFKVNSSIEVVGIFPGRRPAGSSRRSPTHKLRSRRDSPPADLFTIQVSPNITLVPEPGTSLLVLTGLLGLAARRMRIPPSGSRSSRCSASTVARRASR